MMQELGLPAEAMAIMVTVLGFSVWADLRLHRNSTDISFRDALAGTLFWIVLAIGFYFYIDWRFGAEYASLFMAGYALEKSLSIDNMMVFVAIFASFGIRERVLQHRILYYGILGAIVFRAIFIGAGTALFGLSTWVELIFALIVLWSAWAILKGGNDEEIEDYSNHWSVRWVRRILPVVPWLQGRRFVLSEEEVQKEMEGNPQRRISQRAAWYVTPALLCLVCIEVSDIVFSFDSVPAIIAVTRDPFLVYAASIFAILGLRSLYFLLSVAAGYLCHLEKAVAFVLVFIAIKLMMPAIERLSGIEILHITHQQSMWVVLGLLSMGIAASYLFPANPTKGSEPIK